MERTKIQILRNLRGGKEKDFWQLLTAQEASLTQYLENLKELWEEESVKLEEKISLTAQGEEKARAQRIYPQENLACSSCKGRGLQPAGKFTFLLSLFQEIARHRPPPLTEFDQGFVSPEVTVARVLYLYQKGELENKTILFLGDDDLTSVAVALTGLPRQIVVAEIDPRLVSFLQQTAARKRWKEFRALTYDVRGPLPKEWQEKFDVAFTDPVETEQGFRLFFSRCAQALKGEEASIYFGLTILESSPQKWYQFQKMILEMGFVLTDIINRFHTYELNTYDFILREYPLASKLFPSLPLPKGNWYTSALCRAEAVLKPRPLVTEGVAVGEELYFEAKENRQEKGKVVS